MVETTNFDNQKDDPQDHWSSYLTKSKMTKTLSWVELEKKTLAKWDGRGMKISYVTDMELKFGIHVIARKIYNLRRLNIVSCEAVDLEYKVVKNNLSLDLAELMLNQFNKNMESVRTSKIIHVSSVHF